MENTPRQIGLRAAVGIIASVVIIAAVFVSGIQLPTTQPPTAQNEGTLVVMLTDAPVKLTHLNVTITNMTVLNSDTGNWTKTPFLNNITEWYTDILALQNVTEDLSITQIPTGNYTKLRMQITTANATYTNGETQTLTVPPEKIDVIIHFTIETDKTTHLLIDMQADWTAISKNGELRPVLKASVTEPEG